MKMASTKKVGILVEFNYEDLELWYPLLRLREAGYTVVTISGEKGKKYTSKHGYPCVSDEAIENVSVEDLSALIIPGGFCPDYLRRDKRMVDLVRNMYTSDVKRVQDNNLLGINVVKGCMMINVGSEEEHCLAWCGYMFMDTMRIFTRIEEILPKGKMQLSNWDKRNGRTIESKIGRDMPIFVRRKGRPVASICHGAWMFCSAKILKGKRATCFHAIKDDVENAGAIYEDSPVVVDGNLITSRIPQDLPDFCKAILQQLGSE